MRISITCSGARKSPKMAPSDHSSPCVWILEDRIAIGVIRYLYRGSGRGLRLLGKGNYLSGV